MIICIDYSYLRETITYLLWSLPLPVFMFVLHLASEKDEVWWVIWGWGSGQHAIQGLGYDLED